MLMHTYIAKFQRFQSSETHDKRVPRIQCLFWFFSLLRSHSPNECIAVIFKSSFLILWLLFDTAHNSISFRIPLKKEPNCNGFGFWKKKKWFFHIFFSLLFKTEEFVGRLIFSLSWFYCFWSTGYGLRISLFVTFCLRCMHSLASSSVHVFGLKKEWRIDNARALCVEHVYAFCRANYSVDWLSGVSVTPINGQFRS